MTSYQYDSANQLLTAEKGESLWHYVYDSNGNLVEVLPNNTETNGAKRYTYNTAGYLTQVETHNGSGWDTQAEMAYNGLGQRLSMDAAGVIAHYVMDGNRPLTATTGNDTTSYLYGLGIIGEETDAWSYALTDGGNTPRQLTDAQGDVTLFVRYNPWGGTLETAGTGNFSSGYLGGILDAATNLIYVGNGQYYDPSTGRFLTRNVNPNNANPYVPWNPIGAVVGPLALFAMIASRRKGRHSKANPYLFMLLMLVVLPLSIGMACDGDGTPTPTNEPEQVEQPSTGTPTPGGGSGGGGAPSTPGAPSPQPTDPCDDLFDGFVRNIIVFGGSYVGNIKAHGPALSQQIPKWTTDRNGIPIAEDNLISYPGYGDNISGKALQAENARRVVAPCDVILIAYSAGTESALMYAKWRVSQGLPVRAIALLGPTFTSYNETQNPDDPNNIPLVFGTTPFDEKGFLDENTLVYNDWSDYVSYLLLKNVDILVWDDAGDKAVGYTKPANATGSFERLHRTNYTHFGTGNNSTNDSDIAKKEVYDWIYSH